MTIQSFKVQDSVDSTAGRPDLQGERDFNDRPAAIASAIRQGSRERNRQAVGDPTAHLG